MSTKRIVKNKQNRAIIVIVPLQIKYTDLVTRWK